MRSATLSDARNDARSRWKVRLRSVAAVVAGLALVVALSSAADAACHATGVYPPPGQPMATGLWVLALAYRGVFQAAGGFVASRLAPSRPRLHAAVLGALGTLVAVLAAAATWSAGPELGPRWYAVALAVLAFPTTWAGALLDRRHGKGRPA